VGTRWHMGIEDREEENDVKECRWVKAGRVGEEGGMERKVSQDR